MKDFSVAVLVVYGFSLLVIVVPVRLTDVARAIARVTPKPPPPEFDPLVQQALAELDAEFPG
jgi:hypothetical protein